EGGQTAVYQLEEYETDRRHAMLVSILLDTAATLTDEILNLPVHDRLPNKCVSLKSMTLTPERQVIGKWTLS
ncbi:hypothetical protein, partial [Pseudomonas veronii]|uniref:hypothetical protein n=1 Tax=Pseudomonas veronii TaxID=76761 RepID=UPI0021C22E85